MSVKSQEILNIAYEHGYITNEQFTIFMQDMLISENGYVLDTGSNLQVNAEVALRLAEKIKKHPLLWKLFFMVA